MLLHRFFIIFCYIEFVFSVWVPRWLPSGTIWVPEWQHLAAKWVRFGTLGQPGWLHVHPKGSLCRPFGSPSGSFGAPKGEPRGPHGAKTRPWECQNSEIAYSFTVLTHFDGLLGVWGKHFKPGDGAAMQPYGLARGEAIKFEATWHEALKLCSHKASELEA